MAQLSPNRDENIRKIDSLKICKFLETLELTPNEKRMAAVALRLLEILDEEQVFSSLLKLLKDGDGNVQLEAAKALELWTF